MILRLGYDIQFELPAPAAIVALLNVHPSRVADLRAPDELRVEPAAQTDTYIDSFGNRCVRFLAQQGPLRLSNSTLVYDTGEPDRQNFNAREIPVQKLPHEALRYLYSSRYCEVDRFSTIALELFGAVPPGYSPFATGYTPELSLDISMRGPRRRLLTSTPNASACAAIFSIWPSPCVAL